MTEIKLDSRLMTVASMVRKNAVLIDIGTDHGYLPCYLVQNGVINSAIASDVRKMPLQSAVETITSCSLGKKIEAILSDGLENIPDNSGDTIVLAGMGGILISEILSKKEWIKNKNIQIIAQPMTHVEKTREFLLNNGFEIAEEKSCYAQNHYYCVISAYYTGKHIKKENGYLYYGELSKNTDENTKKYLEAQFNRIKKRYDALKLNSPQNPECEFLGGVLQDFKKNINFDN